MYKEKGRRDVRCNAPTNMKKELTTNKPGGKESKGPQSFRNRSTEGGE